MKEFIKKLTRQQADTKHMQSGFKPELIAIYYNCIWRRLQKKYLKEGLVTRIVDFEKAFKRIAMDIMDIV